MGQNFTSRKEYMFSLRSKNQRSFLRNSNVSNTLIQNISFSFFENPAFPCHIVESNKTSFQKTKSRTELINLMKTLPPETSKFLKIQHALLMSNMHFFVDEDTGNKYSLSKPEERLLGGAKTIYFSCNGGRFMATLEDPIPYGSTFDRDLSNRSWRHDWSILRYYIPYHWPDFYEDSERTIIENIDGLKSRNSTIDRQPPMTENGVITHYNISYQTGKDSQRYSYGVALIDQYGILFRETSGSYVKRAINESVIYGCRYIIHVTFYQYKSCFNWEIVEDPDLKQEAFEACNRQLEKNSRWMQSNIQQLSREIQQLVMMLMGPSYDDNNVRLKTRIQNATQQLNTFVEDFSTLNSIDGEYTTIEYRNLPCVEASLDIAPRPRQENRHLQDIASEPQVSSSLRPLAIRLASATSSLASNNIMSSASMNLSFNQPRALRFVRPVPPPSTAPVLLPLNNEQEEASGGTKKRRRNVQLVQGV